MLKTLGPRGDVGVNPIAVYKALENLDLLVDAAKRYGPTRLMRSGNGMEIRGCAKMGGRTRANAKRRAEAISNV